MSMLDVVADEKKNLLVHVSISRAVYQSCPPFYLFILFVQLILFILLMNHLFMMSSRFSQNLISLAARSHSSTVTLTRTPLSTSRKCRTWSAENCHYIMYCCSQQNTTVNRPVGGRWKCGSGKCRSKPYGTPAGGTAPAEFWTDKHTHVCNYHSSPLTCRAQ